METTRFLSTGPTPDGAAEISAVPVSFTVRGNRKLANTAATPANSVENRYRKITYPKRESRPPEPPASDEITSTNTRTGAIAFSAPTNRSPNSEMTGMSGIRSPRTTPIARPITIRRIRLVSLYFFITFCTFMYASFRRLFCFFICFPFSTQNGSIYLSDFKSATGRLPGARRL